MSKDEFSLPLAAASDSPVRVHLPLPAVGRLQDGHVKLSALPASGTPGDFTGQGEDTGLTVRRGHKLTDNGVELEWTVAASRAFENISLQQTVEFDLPWTSYVIAPGVLYAGNRFLVSPQPYAPYIPTEGVSPDGPILIADVPRLASATGYRTDLAANALTTPFVGIFDPASGRGVLIEVPLYGDWGVAGLTLTTLPGERVTVTVTLPVQRSRRYRFCDWTEVNDEPGLTLAAGQSLTARLRVIPVAAATVPAFIAELSRRAFAARDQGGRTFALSLAEAAQLVEAKQNAHNWNEAEGYYRADLNLGSPWSLQTGWVSGGVTMLAMLLSPDAATQARARRMLDFLCTAAAPSGYFYGARKDGKWLSLGGKRPGCRSFMLVRRPLELGRDILKAIDLLRARGEPINPAWTRAAQGCLDAVVGTVRRYGHLGYSVDPETGDVLWGDSTGGAYGIEFLVRGHVHFGRAEYLETAKQLAVYYREHFLLRGFTCGGVGDALMAVDSESNYALLSGLVELHAVTHQTEHLAWAVEAAELFQTWVLLYDAQLPAASPLGRLGIQPRGAVFANIQNQHGAPGICTASGLALRKLARQTGDERWELLLREIVACQPQMTVQSGQKEVWGDLPVGCLSERLMTMDGMAPTGQTSRLSTWCEIALLLASRELNPTLSSTTP